jgi:ribokinase
MDKEGVLVVGSANMDMVVTVDRFPFPGETIFGKKYRTYPGGKGANQAVACAKLGVRTYFIGKFGDDDFCETLTNSMRNVGVNLNNIFIDKEENTGTALITIDKEGQNKIIVISGSNMKLSLSDIESQRMLFGHVKIVLAQLEIPLDTVLKTAELSKKEGAIFILNPAPAQQLPDELLHRIDFLTPNEIELEQISGIKVSDEESAGKAALDLINRGVRNVIVTLGSNGSLLVNKNEIKKFPAIEVQAVDTTGAGDSFNGAFAFSLAKGNDMEKSVKFANKVASICVTRMGAQSSMPFYNEVELFENQLI